MRYILTPFQEQCDSQLNLLFQRDGISIVDRAVLGENENYIYARIINTNIELWIYDDEASITGPDIDQRFEIPDYNGPHELMIAFLNAVKSLAAEASRRP